MGQETRNEIDRLERRLAELRAQQDSEKVTVRVRGGGRGGRAPMPGPEQAPPPPLPKLQVEVKVDEAPESASSSEAPRKRAPRRKSSSQTKKAKRLEQAVVGMVIVFFGGCMALVATQGKSKPADEEKKAEAPKSKPSSSGDGEGQEAPTEDDDNLAPDPAGVCQMLVSAGVAESCSPSETAGEGERVAVFELAGEKGGTGRVRTFDSSARCQQAGGPGGGHWYARCDALTAIVIPSHTDAEGTLAARRVAARL